MIKVESISATKNPKVVKVEFVQVLNSLDIARGFGKAKRAFITADADKNTFVEGQTYPQRIKMVAHDEAQYEDHEPFDGNGKFYTSEIVD